MKTLKTIIYTLAALLTIWITLSYAEVITHNNDAMTGAPHEYNKLNFFVLLFSEDKEVEHTQYTTYGRYYTDGTIITDDGNIWDYQTDMVSDREVYDNMPVWIAFDDNGTPDDITDDPILGLVYDMNTAIYDDLEAALSESFTVTREGNNLTIKP